MGRLLAESQLTVTPSGRERAVEGSAHESPRTVGLKLIAPSDRREHRSRRGGLCDSRLMSSAGVHAVHSIVGDIR